jgi:uncharacterized protein YdhG (YjbR/CyaY superfamily)
MKKGTVNNVDQYISGFPPCVQEKLSQLRGIVIKNAPKAQEVLSYGMPAYKYYGILVYFAGHTNHIGLYPTATGIEYFKKELQNYTTSKGTVQFPLDEPLPVRLIARIVKFKVKENSEKLKAKKII